jgi:hypothetical protein
MVKLAPQFEGAQAGGNIDRPQLPPYNGSRIEFTGIS